MSLRGALMVWTMKSMNITKTPRSSHLPGPGPRKDSFMATTRLAEPRRPDTRELRALALAEESGREIERLAGEADVYLPAAAGYSPKCVEEEF
jgi:hypothetical protein